METARPKSHILASNLGWSDFPCSASVQEQLVGSCLCLQQSIGLQEKGAKGGLCKAQKSRQQTWNFAHLQNWLAGRRGRRKLCARVKRAGTKPSTKPKDGTVNVMEMICGFGDVRQLHEGSWTQVCITRRCGNPYLEYTLKLAAGQRKIAGAVPIDSPLRRMFSSLRSRCKTCAIIDLQSGPAKWRRLSSADGRFAPPVEWWHLTSHADVQIETGCNSACLTNLKCRQTRTGKTLLNVADSVLIDIDLNNFWRRQSLPLD